MGFACDLHAATRILYDPNRAHIGNMAPEVIEPGFSRSTVTIPVDATNADGGAFGGFLMALVDVAASTIPWSYDRHSVTQSADLHFVRGVSIGETFALEARGVHIGRTSCIVEVKMLDATASPIVGCSSPARVDDAVAALDVTLSPDEVAFLEDPYTAHELVGPAARPGEKPLAGTTKVKLSR